MHALNDHGPRAMSDMRVDIRLERRLPPGSRLSACRSVPSRNSRTLYEWGEFLLTDSQARSGSRWSDDGKSVRPRRELKHRAEGETRTVPIHPDLVKLLRAHLAEFGSGPGGHIFSLPRGRVVTSTAYLVIFHNARAAAFTEAEAESLVAQRPYDLRHAAVSTWLNATGDPAQVAEWAGHSVNVLMQVYAKCISGRQEAAKRRIYDATRPLGEVGPTNDIEPED